MIRVVSLTLVRRGRRILSNITLEAKPGEIHAILGPNGAGKTTLLRVLAGLEKPTSGYAVLAGLRVPGAPREYLARLVGYVPQSPRHASLTVLEYVLMQRLLARNATRPADEDLEAAYRALERVGVEELADRSLDKLSGGQRMLVEIARAISHDPPVLLLDEPVAPLDPRNQHRVLTLLKQLAENGKTILIVMHDLTLAANYADRVTVLKDGVIVASGSPSDTLTPETIRETYGARALILNAEGYRVVATLPDE